MYDFTKIKNRIYAILAIITAKKFLLAILKKCQFAVNVEESPNVIFSNVAENNINLE